LVDVVTTRTQLNMNNSSYPSTSPTNTCNHWQSLDVTSLAALYRQQSFQSAFQRDKALKCADCNSIFPNTELWICLHCNSSYSLRCGRSSTAQHAIQHWKESKANHNSLHCVVMNLSTRSLWCYECDNEIVDDYNKHSSEKIIPQQLRQILNEKDSNDNNHPTDDSKEEESHTTNNSNQKVPTWREYLNNTNGGLVGMANLGNTCFLNSGIQALLHCPQLISYFAELPSTIPNETARQRLIHDFSILMRKFWSGRYSTCTPNDLVRDIIYLNPFFRGYQQHDSQELIRCVLDNLHEGMKLVAEYDYTKLKGGEIVEEAKDSKGQKSSSPHSANSENESNGTAAADSQKSSSAPKKRKFESSIISDMFQGILQSQVKCSNCSAISVVYDPFYDLSLEMPQEKQMKRIEKERGTSALTQPAKAGLFSSFTNFIGLSSPPLSLATCLHSFCTSDRLLHGDQYKCDQCKQKVDATKHLAVNKLPEVLVLHIKRFAHNTYFGSKLTRQVNLPLINLDMMPFLDFHAQKHIKQARSSANKAKNEQMDRDLRGNSSEIHSETSASSFSSNSADIPDPGNSNFGNSTLFDLFAVVRHMGSVSGGHYIAYCKHHLTQKWYEFDDRVVTEVSEATVSKVEAYVLFYQRKHSKHNKSIESALKLVENSLQNPARRNSEPNFYVSKQWLRKLEIFHRPEPIDNRDLCCEHGKSFDLSTIGSTSSSNNYAVSVEAAIWQQLIEKFGGGPNCSVERKFDCSPCSEPLIRAAEKKRIHALDQEATRSAAQNEPFYLINDHWLSEWRQYIAGSGPRPGKISNTDLFEADGATVKQDLQKGVHYRGLHGIVWKELLRVYGGGPTIMRTKLNIYDASPLLRKNSGSRSRGSADGSRNNSTSNSRAEENANEQPVENGLSKQS
jgi:ubiquitin carboxyl-terminal hydrolase 20/33